MKKIVCGFVFGLMLMVSGAQAWADGTLPDPVPPNPRTNRLSCPFQAAKSQTYNVNKTKCCGLTEEELIFCQPHAGRGSWTEGIRHRLAPDSFAVAILIAVVRRSLLRDLRWFFCIYVVPDLSDDDRDC